MDKPEMSAQEAYDRFKNALVDDNTIREYINKYGTGDVPELKEKHHHLLGSLTYYFVQVEGHAELFLKDYDGEEAFIQAKHLMDAYGIKIDIEEVFDIMSKIDDMRTEIKNELEKISEQKKLLYKKCEEECGHQFEKKSEYCFNTIGGQKHYLVCKKCGLKLESK